MNVLVAVASRHGSTQEIAQAIVEELRLQHLDAELHGAGGVSNLDPYGAVVLGSAVYMGGWLPEARKFVEEHQAKLAAVPVWLFSSGPLGDDEPEPQADPTHLAELMAATGAREHRVFSGKLDKSALGVGERLITRVVRAPYGDFRDWKEIRNWAREIAATLQQLEIRPEGQKVEHPPSVS